ncbi:hypothetical protein [Streptomyces griseoruber]|uniref:AbiTii domain-containing protein n=1 Tax=Streptomyces griseoruber TaxID=1943 RepID=UPI0006E404CC|nr:hypothetical protein [Streptomyces griseoruber]
MIFRRSRLDRLERALRHENRPLAPILREVIMLGGEAHSAALRTWALHELQGYENSDVPIPGYRRIVAPLMMDFVTRMSQFTGHQVSFFDLPDFAREDLGDEVRLGQAVHQIESLIASHRTGAVSMSVPMAASLAEEMSRASGRHVVRLYWSVHVSALEGVLDQVRTRLVQLVAELKAAMPRGQQDPTPDQVAQVIQNLPGININAGDNASISVNVPVAVAHQGGTASANVTGPGWAAQRMPLLWTVLVALAAATVVTAWITWP